MISTITNWLMPKAHAATFNFLKPAQTGGSTQISSIANTVINFVLLIAGILAIAYLIYSGILYITAAGNPDSAKKGQQGVINAIIGIIIIILAYYIARVAVGLGTGIQQGTVK
ncbi:MAG: hypothetical protein WCG99_01540 [Candidatus Berkelbacteria bacterium]